MLLLFGCALSIFRSCEISRMKLKTAEKEKEATMLLVYNSLLQQDISQMTEESKARRDKNLAMMEKKLFSNNDEV